MKFGNRHIMMVFSAALLLLSLAACSRGSESVPDVRPTLSIYIYVPDRIVPTRAAVRATEAEDSIHNMQIWVFKHNTDSYLGYLSLTQEQLLNLNSSLHSESYSMEIPKEFAEHPSPVDVYVLANVTEANCGVTLGNRITRSELLDYQMKSAYFYDYGTTAYDSRYGLPMTVDSVNLEVSGKDMVLHVSSGQMCLRRAVSKVQFAFSKSVARGNSNIMVEKITLDAGVVPKNEYLFLGADNDYRSTKDYQSEVATLIGTDKRFPMLPNDDPEDYVYSSATFSDVGAYMNEVAQAAAHGKIALSPPVYLRETDKALRGSIYYSVDGDMRSARFEMSGAGRFYRNSTWLVYGYFNAGELDVSTVTIPDWEDGGSSGGVVSNW